MSCDGTCWMPEPGLYLGEVKHRRLRPFPHRFTYRMFWLLVDIDRLGELARRLRLLSVDHPNLLSFRASDHGAGDGTPLRPWVERELASHGLDGAGARILLLCFPRLFGYAFNPLSIYYCYGREGTLRAIVLEVKNTFGEQHAYVLPVGAARAVGQPIRGGCAKSFYVSPFIAPSARYRFRLSEPGERLSAVVHEEVEEGPQLMASLTARWRPLTDRELVRAVLSYPLMTHKVTAAIYWQALRLWWKGARRWPRAGGRRKVPPALPESILRQ